MNLEVGASHVGLSWILAEKRLSPEQCDNRTPLSPLCWTQPPPARWPGLSILPGLRYLGQAPSGEWPHTEGVSREALSAELGESIPGRGKPWALVWQWEGERPGPCWGEGQWAVWRCAGGTGYEGLWSRKRSSIIIGKREPLRAVSEGGP